jgi:hypothetical protein
MPDAWQGHKVGDESSALHCANSSTTLRFEKSLTRALIVHFFQGSITCFKGKPKTSKGLARSSKITKELRTCNYYTKYLYILMSYGIYDIVVTLITTLLMNKFTSIVMDD